MKTIDVIQGSPEWLKARAGRPTASCADMILTPAQLKKSASWDRYMGHLIAEWYLGMPIETPGSAFMERGKEMEIEAADWYAFDRGAAVQTVGLCLTDDESFGASPDRLVDADGLAEIKCPGAIAHGGYMVNPASLKATYYGQAQAELFVTGREWVDLLSYNPVMPAVCVRIEPSPEWASAFGKALGEFTAALRATQERFAEQRAAYLAGRAEAAAGDDHGF